MATTEWDPLGKPDVANRNVPEPADAAPRALADPLSKKLTVPVAPDGVTIAVKVTGDPVLPLPVSTASVTDVGCGVLAWLIVSVTAADVDGLNAAVLEGVKTAVRL